MPKEMLNYILMFMFFTSLVIIIAYTTYTDYKQSKRIKITCRNPLFTIQKTKIETTSKDMFKKSFAWEGGAVYPIENTEKTRVLISENDVSYLPKELRSVLVPPKETRYTTD